MSNGNGPSESESRKESPQGTSSDAQTANDSGGLLAEERMAQIPFEIPSSLRSATNIRFSVDRSAGLREASVDIHVLKPSEIAIIEGARGAVFDVDDTLLQGSGEIIHDGPTGRFRGGVNLALQELGLSPISADEWQEKHRSVSGADEAEVIRQHALLAGVDPARVAVLQQKWWKEHLPTLIEQINLLDGTEDLLAELDDIGIPRAVCSASSIDIVRPMLELTEIYHYFDVHVGSAGKRVGPKRYCHGPFQQTCREMGRDPRDVLMIGDSVADVATHRLGAAVATKTHPDGNHPISVLVAPRQEKLAAKFQEMEHFFDSHDVTVTQGPIIVVQSARQLKFVDAEGPLRWSVRHRDDSAS